MVSAIFVVNLRQYSQGTPHSQSRINMIHVIHAALKHVRRFAGRNQSANTPAETDPLSQSKNLAATNNQTCSHKHVMTLAHPRMRLKTICL